MVVTDDLPSPATAKCRDQVLKTIQKTQKYGFSIKCERFFQNIYTVCALSPLTASLWLGSRASPPRTLVTNDFDLELLQRYFLLHVALATCNYGCDSSFIHMQRTCSVTASRAGRLGPVRRLISFFLRVSSWCEKALCCMLEGLTGNLDGEKRVLRNRPPGDSRVGVWGGVSVW